MTGIVTRHSRAHRSALSIFWREFRRNKGALVGFYLLLPIILMAIVGPWIAPYDPAEQFSGHLLQPPSWRQAGTPEFLLGTDDLGRDILSRILYGARLSLGLASIIVLLAASVGVLLGSLAALTGKVVESVLMRIADIILALPSLLLAIAIVALLGPGLPNAIYAVAIVLIPHFMRITRAAIRDELGRDYVTAARLDGARGSRMFVRVLLPNILAPLIVQTTLSFSTALLDIAALGFLGLGAQPPVSEWGTLLSQSRAYIQLAPWTVTTPGLAILVTVLAINLLGDGVRDALDPRLSR